MIWNTVSFDWNQVRAFLATVEEGSLSAAARALGLTQPTLGRQVAGLEQALGVVLFERVGRSLSLTPSGLELLDHVRAMGEAASRISLTASGQSQDINGQVRITASDVFSSYLLPPIVARLRAEAPGLEIHIIAANDIRDLQHREADIAIRHVRPDQPELIARLVGDVSGHFYAATSYLDQRGRPQTKADLAAHDFISFGDPMRMIDYLSAFDIPLQRQNFPINSENGIVAWAMTQQGLGILPISDTFAAQTPGIEQVLPQLAPFSFPMWLTTHRELHTSRRIRLVFDILAEELSK